MMDFKTIQRPYLIQRGTFRDVKDEDIVGLDSLISYDYMGSSEFEWGALPASLKRVTHSWKDYHIVPIEDIKDADGQILHLLCRKGQEEEIVQVLKIFAVDEYHPDLRTLERVGLFDHIQAKRDWDLRVNFWWDITGSDSITDHFSNRLGNGNDWMACFGDNIRRLVIAIGKVCVKHGVPVEGPAVPVPQARPVKEMDVQEDGKVITIMKARLKTTLVKRKILEVQDLPDLIKIKVKTKSGAEKFIEIREKPSSARTLLLNLVKDWPEINKT